MKKYLLTTVFILLFLNNSAQDEIKLYLDVNFNQVKKIKDAVVLRKATITNDHYIIEDQYVKGGMINYGEYISINPFIEDGLSKHFQDGYLYSMGNYKNGTLTGKWIYADWNNNDTVDYSPVEKYLSELKVPCSTLHISDLDTTSTKELLSIKENLREFIYQNAHFPARARGITDYQNIIIALNLDTNGLITCTKIFNCSDRDITYELLRVAMLYKGEHKIPASISIQDPLYNDMEPAFVFTEEQASFQGGSLEDFRLWVHNNLVYPKEALEKSIIGRVTVQFAVSSRGIITDVSILRGVDSSLDQEAYRVIMSSPKWEAAKQGGKAVKQQFVMPVIFNIDEKVSGMAYYQNDTIKASYNGITDIREFIQQNVIYPSYAVENGIDGTVFYSFKITKEGCVDSILFKKSPHKSFNTEIKKILLETNCKWKPAYYNGSPVDVWIDSKVVFIVQ